MAKEHHCPNCGPQACNASTSKIHTCGVCAAVWEEIISDAPAVPPPKPAPSATVPPAGAPPAAPRPASPAPAPAPAAAPKAAVLSPAQPVPVTTKPAPAPQPVPVPPKAAPALPSAPPVQGDDRPAPRAKRLADVVATAKARRCPACQSESLAAPSDYIEQGGRVILVDSQTYFGHRWYADTGEVLKAAPPPKPAPPSASPPATTAA